MRRSNFLSLRNLNKNIIITTEKVLKQVVTFFWNEITSDYVTSIILNYLNYLVWLKQLYTTEKLEAD